jgi:hypothetical protein
MYTFYHLKALYKLISVHIYQYNINCGKSSKNKSIQKYELWNCMLLVQKVHIISKILDDSVP